MLRWILTAALAGILVYTGFRLIDFKGLRHLWKANRPELIFLTTVSVIVIEVTDRSHHGDCPVGIKASLSVLTLGRRFDRVGTSHHESTKN